MKNKVEKEEGLTFHPEINKDNYDQYLSDGIHLNDAGKEVYASALADFIGEIN